MAAAVDAPAEGVNKREILAWAMFDVANSAYTTVVITIVFSAFFVNYLVPEDSTWSHRYWAVAMAGSNILAMLLAPFLGTACDLGGHKKRFLLITTCICSAATAAIALVSPGQIYWAIGLIIISNTAWMLTEVFSASFLTDIATEKNMGWISGLGWGMGYLGGLVSLIWVLFFIITTTAVDNLELYIRQNQYSMLFVGVYFLLVSLPTFILLKERRVNSVPLRWFEIWQQTCYRLQHAWQLSRQLPVLLQFFMVFTLYSAGMAVVIKFFGIYVESELNLSAGQQTGVFLALQVSAFAGALLFGLLELKVGPKPTLFLTLLWWIAGILSIIYLSELARTFAMAESDLFICCAVLAGSALGSTQSASRTMVGLLSPLQYSTMMFGFWGLFARLAAVIGSLAYAWVADTFSVAQAMWVILMFFVFGAGLILFVPFERGLQQAKQRQFIK